MNIKKLIICVVFVIICQVLFITANIYALDYEEVSENFAVPEEYAFTPKWSTQSYFTNSNDFESLETERIESDGLVVKKLVVDSQSFDSDGNVLSTKDYSSYSYNIGMYKGRMVNAKLSLIKVSPRLLPTECNTPELSLSGLRFGYGKRGCSNKLIKAYFKLQFIYADTNEEVTDIKSSISFGDIDAEETILVNNTSTVKALVLKTSDGQQHLDISTSVDGYTMFTGNLYHTCTRLNGDVGQTGECGGKEYYIEGTCLPGKTEANCKEDYKSGILTTLNNGAFIFGFVGMGGVESTSFLVIETPAPIKSLDKTVIKQGETFNYKIEQYVPNQNTDYYYKKFVIEDNIDTNLTTSASNVRVINDAQQDVTSKFDITLVNNKLSVSAKSDTLSDISFYNTTYTINIPITTNVTFPSTSKLEISNIANLVTSFGDTDTTTPSNEAKVTVYPVPDVEITADISHNSDETINNKVTLTNTSKLNACNTTLTIPIDSNLINIRNIEMIPNNVATYKLENNIITVTFTSQFKAGDTFEINYLADEIIANKSTINLDPVVSIYPSDGTICPSEILNNKDLEITKTAHDEITKVLVPDTGAFISIITIIVGISIIAVGYFILLKNNKQASN